MRRKMWQEKFLRARTRGFRPLLRDGSRVVRELATARLYLQSVDVVGHSARTLGRPRIENQGKMTLGDDVVLRSKPFPLELVTGPKGTLVIGDHVFINFGTSIGAMGSIHIGSRVQIGPYVMIIDTDFHDLHDRMSQPPPKAVVIDDDVWIGAKASILSGVHIGRGSVIAVGAVVNRDVAPFTLVGGVPAKKLKDLDPNAFERHNDERDP